MEQANGASKKTGFLSRWKKRVRRAGSRTSDCALTLSGFSSCSENVTDKASRRKGPRSRLKSRLKSWLGAESRTLESPIFLQWLLIAASLRPGIFSAIITHLQKVTAFLPGRTSFILRWGFPLRPQISLRSQLSAVRSQLRTGCCSKSKLSSLLRVFEILDHVRFCQLLAFLYRS